MNGLLHSEIMKRVIDILGSSIGLLFFSPIILFIIVTLRLTLGKPVLFQQHRVGLHGNIFTLYKFRTMSDEKDISGNWLPDEIRVSRFGRILRRVRLDELPQLLAAADYVLSSVGPRPLLPSSLNLLSEKGRKRLLMKPGLTGWSQVNGNTLLSLREKEILDLWYVENWNLLLDLKIMLLTFIMVFFGERRNDKLIAEASDYAECTDRCSRQH